MAKKNNSHASVTIIIPVYNGEKTISACLDSLLNQTGHPNEIIVVNDGSTDQTLHVLETYSLVKIINQKNKGPAHARNEGARAAKSEIVLFLDSDCIPEKNWLEEMLLPFTDEKVMGVQGSYQTKQKSLVARFDQLDIEYRYDRMKRAKKLDWIGSYSAAYRRKTFLAEGGFDETFPRASGEDAEFSYRLAEKGYRLVFAPRAVVYHTHPATVMHYLRVKFFRAYWRTRMYLKHPGKSVRDSYTPHVLKINFFVGGIFLAALAYLIFQFATSPFSRSLVVSEVKTVLIFLGIIMGVIVLSLFDFIQQIARKDILLLPFGMVLIFLRSLTFVLGALFGLLDPRVRS